MIAEGLPVPGRERALYAFNGEIWDRETELLVQSGGKKKTHNIVGLLQAVRFFPEREKGAAPKEGFIKREKKVPREGGRNKHVSGGHGQGGFA